MTTHLNVLGEPACGGTLWPDEEALVGDGMVGPDDFDDIDCDPCKGTRFYAAAERIAAQQAHHTTGLLDRLLESHTRIDGPLGDRSVLTEDMTPGERLKALSATVSPERKVEWLHRISDMVNDTCPGCGGSLKYDEHAEDCPGPDPEKWELTDEQIDAELRVLGIDPEPAKARLMRTMDEAIAKRKAALEQKEAEGDPT